MNPAPRAGAFPGHLHPGYATGTRTLVVRGLARLVPGIIQVELADPDGHMLTPFQPGSHIIVTAGDEGQWRNAYSLTDDGLSPSRYAISVLRSGTGQGSDWLHEHLHVGARIRVEGPRAMFPPAHEQRHALLLAGGIGITPILSHARALARAGRQASVLYAFRPGHGAHASDLRDLCERAGFDLVEAAGADEADTEMKRLLADQPLGTHSYACGPVSFLAAYEANAAAAGWPTGRVHLERFTAPELDPGEPFTARVASTGQRVEVPSGVSLLTALADAGIRVPFLCRQGVCGECVTGVRSAVGLLHRDFVLTTEEREGGRVIMPCVSRAAEIEVDL